MKACNKCGVSKPHDSYAKTRPAVCKACTSEYNRAYRAANREKISERMKVYQKDYRERTRDERVAVNRLWRERNKEKVDAHNALGNAIRFGKITKPLNCSDCNDSGRLEAHHEDYTKHLDVEWLCSSCHRLRHVEQATA